MIEENRPEPTINSISHEEAAIVQQAQSSVQSDKPQNNTQNDTFASESFSARENDNYDDGFTTKIDQIIKDKINLLVNPGHQDKLKNIKTVGGAVRLIREELTVLRTANSLSIELYNRLSPVAHSPAQKEKLNASRLRVEKSRERVLALVTIKHQLEAVIETQGR